MSDPEGTIVSEDKDFHPDTAEIPTLVVVDIEREAAEDGSPMLSCSFYMSAPFLQAVADAEKKDVDDVDVEVACDYRDRCLESALEEQEPPFKFQIIPVFPGITSPAALQILDELQELEKQQDLEETNND